MAGSGTSSFVTYQLVHQPTFRDAQEQHHSNKNHDGKRRTTLKSDIYSFGRKPILLPEVVAPYANGLSDHASYHAATGSQTLRADPCNF